MTITKIDILSLGKILMVIYAALGFLGGLVFASLSVFGFALTGGAEGIAGGLFALLFGMGSVILLPILYGFMGFLTGLIAGALFNLAAGLVGGLPVETL